LKDSLSDYYINPLENVTTTNNINHVWIVVMKPRIFEIPVINCRREQRLPNYKDVDHQGTKALRKITEQRTQQTLFQLIFP
jgi:hypothetical protein